MIKIKIRSTYAIGLTDSSRSRFGSGKDLVVHVDPGTTIEELLRKFPSLGPAESFDDIQIQVFVNRVLRGFDHVLQPGDEIDIHIPSSGG